MRRQPRLLVVAALAAVLVPAMAMAQPFTVADVEGPFGIRFNRNDFFPDNGFDMVGTLVLDGAGNVTGQRTLWSPPSSSAGRTTMEQTFTGTYEVTPEGRVTLTIAPTPPIPDTPHGDFHIEYDDTETIQLALVDGGRRLFGNWTIVKDRIDRSAGVPRPLSARGELISQRSPCCTTPTAVTTSGPLRLVPSADATPRPRPPTR